MRHFLGLLLTLLLCAVATAQNFTLSGHVQDASSGEQLLGATIWCTDAEAGAAGNTYGFYSLTLPAGEHDIVVSYIGYSSQLFTVDFNANLKMDFELVAGTALGEAVVTGEAFNRIEDRVQMSKIEVPIEQIKRIPAIGGEVDLLKALQLLPGIQSGGEGSSGLYVRGGSPDQNLMLLDGVPLYSVSHLFGFFSVFNADAVKNMSITKGGFPARFGGRLSSILEINLKDGHMKELHGDATVSMIASKLTLEGPLAKDKASFMISARRTYLDVLLGPAFNAINNNDGNSNAEPRYYFYDLNGKINWKISPRDRVFFSAFSGKDDFGFKSESVLFGSSPGESMTSKSDFGLDWENSVQAARWNHEWSPQLFSNVSLTRSYYRFNTGIEFSDITTANDTTNTERFAALYRSGIEDYAAQIDFDYAPNADHYIRTGAKWTHHRFSPGATQLELDFGQENPIDTLLGASDINSNDAYLYIEDEVSLSNRLKANFGLHTSFMHVQKKMYASLQPRLAVNYTLPSGTALKASYARMNQYVNLLTNEGLGLPTDLWVPSTANIRPQQSWQVALGLAKTLSEFELSFEGYYKEMDGLLSYRDGASFMFSLETNWEEQVTQGIGNAYGFELLAQKKVGRTTGWIGYTLSWSNRKFDEINSGDWYPFTYDRRHDVSLVVNHDLGEHWGFSAAWMYGTGRALTLSESVYSTFTEEEDGTVSVGQITVPSGKNAFRMSPFHRLDLSFIHIKRGENFERSLIFSAYNAYNNLNPFFALLDKNTNGQPVIVEYGIFPIIPSIAWRVSF